MPSTVRRRRVRCQRSSASLAIPCEKPCVRWNTLGWYDFRMNGVLDVLKVFIHKIGDYQNTFVLSSRSGFMKHLEG